MLELLLELVGVVSVLMLLVEVAEALLNDELELLDVVSMVIIVAVAVDDPVETVIDCELEIGLELETDDSVGDIKVPWP